MGSSIQYPVSRQPTITSSLTVSLKAKKSYKPPKKVEDALDFVSSGELVRLYGNADEAVPPSFKDLDRDVTNTEPVDSLVPEPVNSQTPEPLKDLPTPSSTVTNKFALNKNVPVKSK